MLTIRRKQRAAFGRPPEQTVASPPAVPPPAAGAAPGGIRMRREQMASFEQEALRPFENEMMAHGKAFAPELCAVIGDDQLLLAVRGSIGRARGYGFSFRGPIRLVVEMMFLFGSAFDTDPQYPWASAILSGKEEDQMRRADALYRKILDYQDKVSGPAGANTLRALRRLLALAGDQGALGPGAGDPADAVRAELARAFPEKAAYIGTPGLAALVSEGCAGARKYRLPAPRGGALMAALMYGFGHGCASDPLYPWIGQTLADERISDPAARAARLEKKAVTWLEHAVGSPRQGASA